MGKPYSHKKDIYTGRVCPKVLNKYAMYQQETGNRNIKAEYIYIQPIRYRSSKAWMNVFHHICKEFVPYIIVFSADLQISCMAFCVDYLTCLYLCIRKFILSTLTLVFSYK